MTLIDWIYSLFIIDEDIQQETPQTPIFEEDTKEEKNSGVYRPLTFNDYIGQKKAKKILQSFMNGTQKFGVVYPHTIIHGNAGCGKTTLAKIIANELNVEFKEMLAQDVPIEEFLHSIKEVNGGVIFLDEIHRMNRDTVEQLYTIMEDFEWNGQKVPEFTLIGATTEIGEIIKNRKPFFERFGIIIELQDYSIDDMFTLLYKYSEKSFNKYQNLQVSDYKEDIKTISENCRSTPRKGIRLINYMFYSQQKVVEVLKDNKIISGGFTEKDLQVLKYLHKINKPIGVDTLSLYLNIPKTSYSYEIEPYLIKTGCLIRSSRGRIITQKGVKKMKKLEKIIKNRT